MCILIFWISKFPQSNIYSSIEFYRQKKIPTLNEWQQNEKRLNQKHKDVSKFSKQNSNKNTHKTLAHSISNHWTSFLSLCHCIRRQIDNMLLKLKKSHEYEWMICTQQQFERIQKKRRCRSFCVWFHRHDDIKTQTDRHRRRSRRWNSYLRSVSSSNWRTA